MVAKKSPAHFAKQAQEAYELSIAGYSQRQIAEKMGVALATVQKRLALYIEGRTMPKADEYRTRQIARLEVYIRSLWTQINNGDPKAIAAAVRTEERIAKLMGTDSATAFTVAVEKTDDALEVAKLMAQMFGENPDDITEAPHRPSVAERDSAMRRRTIKGSVVKSVDKPHDPDKEFAKDATFAAHEVQPEAFRIAEDLEEFEPERPEPILNARDIQNARHPANNNHKLLRDYDDD